MKNFTPPTLKEWQEFGYQYACNYEYIDFPIDRMACYRLLHNAYEYFFDDDCRNWKKGKKKDWKKTVMNWVRRDAGKMKDWNAKKDEGKYESV